MTKFLFILLLIAVIGVIVWLAARSRATTADAVPADDRPSALAPGHPHEAAIAPPPADIAESMEALFEHPEPVERLADDVEVLAESVPPMEPEPGVEPLPEPDPIVEPEPPMEPEPIIEPDPQPIDPETVVEEADEPSVGPPQAVIDAGEMPAGDLDPHAGWGSDDDRTIHADPESGLYHTPDSPGYKLGPDGQVFESEEEAQSAGFTRWDQLS